MGLWSRIFGVFQIPFFVQTFILRSSLFFATSSLQKPKKLLLDATNQVYLWSYLKLASLIKPHKDSVEAELRDIKTLNRSATRREIIR